MHPKFKQRRVMSHWKHASNFLEKSLLIHRENKWNARKLWMHKLNDTTMNKVKSFDQSSYPCIQCERSKPFFFFFFFFLRKAYHHIFLGIASAFSPIRAFNRGFGKLLIHLMHVLFLLILLIHVIHLLNWTYSFISSYSSYSFTQFNLFFYFFIFILFIESI
jgi:hypothetical protein